MELISVVIPVYNIQTYLKECLNSVKNQTYKNIEIILVDDGSTDNSGTICDDYAKIDSRIIVLHKKNRGVSSARNEGIKVATGKYISFIDSDDWIAPDMLEKLYIAIKDSDSSIACCTFSEVTSDGRIIFPCGTYKHEIITSKMIAKKFCDEGYVKNVMFPPWNKLFRRDVTAQIKFRNGLRMGEDFLFCMECVTEAGEMVIVDEPLYFYRLREGSAMTSSFSEKRLDYLIAAKEIVRIYRSNYPEYLQTAEFWLYKHVLITQRQIEALEDKNKFCLFSEEMKSYLVDNRKKFWNKMSIMRKMDYFGIIYCRFYFRIIAKLKEIEGGKKRKV